MLCLCCCLELFVSSFFHEASSRARARVLTMSEPTNDDVEVDQAAADLKDVEVVASETAAGGRDGGGARRIFGTRPAHVCHFLGVMHVSHSSYAMQKQMGSTLLI